MRSEAGDRPNVGWRGDGFRLIPSRFPPVSIYEDVVAEDRLDALVAIENLTNPRLQSAHRLMGLSLGLSPDSPRLQNWNHAPFAYSNPEGSRFFPPERPCLELCDSRQTALAVSVARRETFLARTQEKPIGLDMRMLKTPVEGEFVDLRDVDLTLLRDPSLAGRKARWKIGETISASAEGVLYRAPERPSSVCISVLKAGVLGRSLQTVHYRYTWNGQRVTKVYAFDDGVELLPESLAGPAEVLAA
ncbi:RES family NAD+ phosphorylase [Xanthobacter oligotrophicus]|uniref:RES family NAD+ phosphorylase n=1 Tax=Xanthobacter oligotrophicus TaxID=2607286 RepID=A0ABW7A560_9HYPH